MSASNLSPAPPAPIRVPEHELIVLRLPALVTPRLLQWYRELWRRPDEPAFSLMLVDCSPVVTHEINHATLVDHVHQRSEMYTRWSERRIGLFCPSPASFGFGRMFENMLEHFGVPVRTFAELEPCAEWLQVPIEALPVER